MLEIMGLFPESFFVVGQLFIDLLARNMQVVYAILIFINLVSMYFNHRDNSYITKKEKDLLHHLLNTNFLEEKKDSESQTDSENESQSESDNEGENGLESEGELKLRLQGKVGEAKVQIVECIYELLLVYPELKNAEISRALGLQSSQHNGYLSMILMKESGLFKKDAQTRLWSIE
jgi:hypothetical protein